MIELKEASLPMVVVEYIVGSTYFFSARSASLLFGEKFVVEHMQLVLTERRPHHMYRSYDLAASSAAFSGALFLPGTPHRLLPPPPPPHRRHLTRCSRLRRRVLSLVNCAGLTIAAP